MIKSDNSQTKGELFWITGLPGSGKSTLSKVFADQLRLVDRAVVLIDGDEFRAVLGDDLGYTPEDRRLNAWRIARMCCYLTSQNLTVICATVSLYHEIRKFLRENVENYREIYLDVSKRTLEARDQKLLYSRAKAGLEDNLIGMQQVAELPDNPDLIINNDLETSDFSSMIESMLKLRENNYKLR